MRAHIVECKTPNTHIFVGSEAAARKVRMELMAAHGLKRAEVDVNFVDIPLNKEDLIAFLNMMVKESQPCQTT